MPAPTIQIIGTGGGVTSGAPTITVSGGLILNSVDLAISGGLELEGASRFIFSTPIVVAHPGSQWGLYSFSFKYRREEQA